MKGQRSHGEAWGKCILVNEGKPNKFVLEPLNFTDIVRGGNCRKRAVLENRSDALFITLDHGGWARSPFFIS